MINMIGFDSKYFKVVSFNSKNKYGIYFWNCICYCGKEAIISTSSLKNGIPRSCGCYKQVRLGNRYKHAATTKHGKAKTPIHVVWLGMKQRCFNPNSTSYKYYGGKGIVMCDEWKNDFVSFMNWCNENNWSKGMHIDRIDSSGNYESDNCRIVTKSENSRLSAHKKSRLTEDIVYKIKESVYLGIPKRKIKSIFKISTNKLSKIVNNKTWKHVEYKIASDDLAQ